MAKASQTGSTAPRDGLTVLGSEIRVNGRVEGDEDLRVEGRVEGSITLSRTLYVDGAGIVVAEVDAQDVVVAGVVVGNVKASNCITLHAGSRLVGDIVAPRIVIEDGAAFRGNVRMGDASAGAAKAAAATARRPSRAPARSNGKPASGRAASRARSAPRPAAAPPIAPIRGGKAGDDDEVTVVVRHAEVAAKDGAESAESKTSKKATKKKAKKAPPRARMPKPGKRRINRR